MAQDKNLPVISILIPTLARDSLYGLVERILEQEDALAFEVVLLAQYPLKKQKLLDNRIIIKYEKPGRGVGFYRKKVLEYARGEIIVFVDDDVLPQDTHWLFSLTRPILLQHEEISVSSMRIPLKSGYITDCISLLGFPAGGAIGADVMWPQKNPQYTTHFFSGNCAIKKDVFRKIEGFSTNFFYICEDNDLEDQIVKQGIKMKYVPEAIVLHQPRRGFVSFCKWMFKRGRSTMDYISLGKNFSTHSRNEKIYNRIASSWRIVKKVFITHPVYFTGVIFMMVVQYICFLSGVFYELIRKFFRT